MKPVDDPQQDLELFPDVLPSFSEGRDELNLAEFPITTVGSRSDPSIKTISFEDTTYDKGAGEFITRRLTVTGSDKYGLPTTLDDEVLLGMIQLSHKQGFRSRDVFFKPSELLQSIGWEDCGPHYARLRVSLSRWHDISLHYDNAWRDKTTGEWVDAQFHFINNVEFSKKGVKSMLAPKGYCYFQWNDIVFKSFVAGNIKSLDFDLFLQLESGVARRMFRFLDKRFHFRSRLTFDLFVFAYEKIGLTRVQSNNPALIKRRLRAGIAELEAIGFILPLAEKFRFRKTRGQWEIHFEKSTAEDEKRVTTPPLTKPAASSLEERLVACGISPDQAQRVVQDAEIETIERQLDHLGFLVAAEKSPANHAGWLVKAIAKNYSPPPGFKSRSDREREKLEKDAKAKARAARRSTEESATKAENEAAGLRIEAYLANLSPAERTALEEAAIKASPLATRGRMGAHAKQAIVANHVLDLLNAGS
ncbi:MAG: replication initiator protein [Verrucomicrobiales bacterium]|nr:replication initiator protein [Verrucomicrobiales bacterium]